MEINLKAFKQFDIIRQCVVCREYIRNCQNRTPAGNSKIAQELNLPEFSEKYIYCSPICLDYVYENPKSVWYLKVHKTTGWIDKSED